MFITCNAGIRKNLRKNINNSFSHVLKNVIFADILVKLQKKSINSG